MVTIVNQDIEAYIGKHLDEESELLKALTRETYSKVLNPRMLSGHLQGRLLSLISKMISPKIILELGTFTGYSAICLAEGLALGGKLHTIDINEELEDFATSYFKKAGLEETIVQYIGDAMELIPTLDETIDLVFIDADKENYCNYFELVLPKVRKGGIILVDNVLWNGKVIEPIVKNDIDTEELVRFNRMVKDCKQVEKLILPIRDGLTLIRKI